MKKKMRGDKQKKQLTKKKERECRQRKTRIKLMYVCVRVQQTLFHHCNEKNNNRSTTETRTKKKKKKGQQAKLAIPNVQKICPPA